MIITTTAAVIGKQNDWMCEGKRFWCKNIHLCNEKGTQDMCGLVYVVESVSVIASVCVCVCVPVKSFPIISWHKPL